MTDESQKYFPWQEGLPTKPDVDLLMKAWPELKVGDVIPYESVEAVIGAKWRSARFTTVTTSWRARLFDCGVVVKCVKNQSFYVASCEQITASTYGTLKTIGRKLRKQRRELSTTKPETATQAAIVEHQGRLLQNIERESRVARRNLLPPTTPPQPPQIDPPRKAQ